MHGVPLLVDRISRGAFSPADAADTAFLRIEDEHTSLHIGAVAIFDVPPPVYNEIANLFATKLPQLPRYRQRVRETPLRIGAPAWAEDPDFELSNHLRRAAADRLAGPTARPRRSAHVAATGPHPPAVGKLERVLVLYAQERGIERRQPG